MTKTIQEQQFADWLRAHSAIALKIARAFERSADAQADLIQEILLQWWRSITVYPPAAPAKPWLYRVSLNTALTWQRREIRRSRLLDRSVIFCDLAEKVAQPAEEPTMPANVSELYSAIRKLTSAERALIVLHLDGLPYEEIASALGISVSAVGSRLTRIRAHLEKLLQRNRKYERV